MNLRALLLFLLLHLPVTVSPLTIPPPVQTFLSHLPIKAKVITMGMQITLIEPFVEDPEGTVCKMIPTPTSNSIRDSIIFWDTYNDLNFAFIGFGAAIGRTKFAMEYAMEVRKWDREVIGIPYGTSSTLQSLDVFHHPNANPKNPPQPSFSDPNPQLLPVVVFVHGGAWSHGSPKLYRTLGRRLRDEGYVSVVVGYRRYPVGSSIDQSSDVGSSLEWVFNNIINYGGDPNNVALIGHSSGAHVSALHLMSRKNKQRVRTFVGLCGVFDVAKHYQWERGRGVSEISALKPANWGEGGEDGMTEGFKMNSPTYIASKMTSSSLRDALPTVFKLYHDTSDTIVPVNSTLEFGEVLRGKVGEEGVEVITTDGKGHGGIVVDLMQGEGGVGDEVSVLTMVRDSLRALDIRGGYSTCVRSRPPLGGPLSARPPPPRPTPPIRSHDRRDVIRNALLWGLTGVYSGIGGVIKPASAYTMDKVEPDEVEIYTEALEGKGLKVLWLGVEDMKAAKRKNLFPDGCGHKVIAFDIVKPKEEDLKEAARHGKEHGYEMEFQQGDAAKLDFPDDSFDAVVCSLFLCQDFDPNVVVNEIRRVLKPKGRFGFYEHEDNIDRVIVKVFGERAIVKIQNYPEKINIIAGVMRKV